MSNTKYSLKRIDLGGTGKMYLIKGLDGSIDSNLDDKLFKQYIYKPAISKFTEEFEPFRGIVQECAYEVQKIVDPDSAIVCRYINQDGIIGSVQEKIECCPNGIDFYALQRTEEELACLPQDIINQFMREFVTDYLLYNFDSHGSNFIIDKNGIIRGVDKEQSFRYMNQEQAQFPSTDYHPNATYFEEEPIYNPLFRLYRDGQISIDYNVIDKYMKMVEQVPDRDYANIFRSYCDACSVAFVTNSSEKLVRIVMRKNDMRKNITDFFDDLTEIRQNRSRGRGKNGR